MGNCKKKTKSKSEAVKHTAPVEVVAPIINKTLEVGQEVVVKYRDGSNRIAKIIVKNNDLNASCQYYIHYQDFNRRMDEWISNDRIVDVQVGSKLVLEKQEITSELWRGVIPSTVADLEHDEHEGLDEASLLEHEEITKIKNVNNILFGKYRMECWYFSPIPKEYYPNGPIDCLYFCEFTFRLFRSKKELIHFQSRPNLPRHPPGNEIYRDNLVSMFEVDGAVEKVYCQNLSYFAKLYLDHKTLFWDVDPFLFYVLCTIDDKGYHPVGYFSKEKYSEMGYNLACILTFPHAQRRGYGRFLMSFSYELSKKEDKVGSPEKPLSDLGALGYKSYWASILIQTLQNILSADSSSSGTGSVQSLSVMDLSAVTSILSDDIIQTLQSLGILQQQTQAHALAPAETHTHNRSQSISSSSPSVPVTASDTTPRAYSSSSSSSVTATTGGGGGGGYVLSLSLPQLQEQARLYPPPTHQVNPDLLHWTPLYVTDPKKDKWVLKAKRSTAAGCQALSQISHITALLQAPSSSSSSSSASPNPLLRGLHSRASASDLRLSETPVPSKLPSSPAGL